VHYQTRLHLVDTDGSGATDILYFNANSFHIFLNQSGNGFSAPITIALKIPYNNYYHLYWKRHIGFPWFSLCLISEKISH
jgi:hypothetical protein